MTQRGSTDSVADEEVPKVPKWTASGHPDEDSSIHGEPTDMVDVRFVTVCGHRLRVAIRPGHGTPLLMFNGMGARLELLTPLARSLQGIETITVDVPGTGESPPPLHPYNMSMLASLTGCLLDKLGYEEVDVFGLSWGGALAQQFAIQNPTRCRRLVLAASMLGAPMVPGSISTLVKLVTPRRFNDPEYARRIAGDLYGGRARTDPTTFADEMETGAGPTDSLGYLFQQWAILGWSGQPWLPTLPQPTLILAGDDDPIIPLVNARWMASMIPHCRLRVFHDGHHFFRTSLRDTTREIRDFLEPAEISP